MPQWFSHRLADLEGFALQKLFPAIIIFVIGLFTIRLISRLISTGLQKAKLDAALIKLIRSLLRVVLFVLLCLVAASALGIDVTGIVALASVLTLAVSLSVQNALSNVIGGFTLLYTKPFISGDFVQIAGQSGAVTDVGLTYTRLATPDNKIISIPNSAVVSAEIVNYTTAGKRRVDIHVCAAYTAPVEQVLVALQESAAVPAVMDVPAPFAGVKGYGESAIEYVLQVWTDADNYWNVHYAVTQNIKTVFDGKGIPMTYPHLNVHLDK